MTITQIQFLDKFARQLADKGFSWKEYPHCIVLTKRVTISGLNCWVDISWLPQSWPVVKTRIHIGSCPVLYDTTVGLLMDYEGDADEILAHIIKQALSGFADTVAKEL